MVIENEIIFPTISYYLIFSLIHVWSFFVNGLLVERSYDFNIYRWALLSDFPDSQSL